MAKLKTYLVTIPITGQCSFMVKADSPEDAMARWSEHVPSDESEMDVEWAFTDPVTEGNVLHASLNEGYAELADDDR